MTTRTILGRRMLCVALALLMAGWAAAPAFGCSVCFSDEASGPALRWAIGLLLALVVLLQLGFARLLRRVLRTERKNAPPQQVRSIGLAEATTSELESQQHAGPFRAQGRQ